MMKWKKDSVSENVLKEKMDAVQTGKLCGSKSVSVEMVVVFVLCIALVILLIDKYVMYEHVSYHDTPIGELDVQDIVDMCDAGELMYENETYTLRTSYELFAPREAVASLRVGHILLFGERYFARAKKDGIYVTFRDKEGKESMELAIVDDIVYAHPAEGKYYKVYIVSRKDQLIECAEQMKNGTHTEWIEKIKKLRGAT